MLSTAIRGATTLAQATSFTTHMMASARSLPVLAISGMGTGMLWSVMMGTTASQEGYGVPAHTIMASGDRSIHISSYYGVLTYLLYAFLTRYNRYHGLLLTEVISFCTLA